MPCYTVREISVEFGKNTNVNALKDAMKELGWREVYASENEVAFSHTETHKTVRFNTASGTFKHAENQSFNVDEIKRPYQRQVVIHNAKRAGWQVVQNKTEPNRIQLRRRA